jgi:hypothetical protein
MTPTDVGTMMPLTSGEESISSLQRTHRPRVPKVQSGLGAGYPVQERSGTGRSLRSLGAPLNAQPLGGPKHYLISRSPGQHVSHAGRGEQRAEVSREDRLPTR